MPRKRGNIMGSKPALDPMEQIEKSQMTITSDTEIRWDDRSVKPSWDHIFGVSLIMMVCVFWFPLVSIMVIGIILVTLLILPYLQRYFELRTLDEADWYEVLETNVGFEEKKKSLLCTSAGNESYVTALNMKKARSELQGDLGLLLRGLDTSHGFLLLADLFPTDAKHI
ncbi:MAG: hypothetical protein ACFFDQ_05270, partial [Candidatus Thorarchaeota archaeon]